MRGARCLRRRVVVRQAASDRHSRLRRLAIPSVDASPQAMASAVLNDWDLASGPALRPAPLTAQRHLRRHRHPPRRVYRRSRASVPSP